jgi:histidine ammonia-lyase
VKLEPGGLSLAGLAAFAKSRDKVTLDASTRERLQAGADAVRRMVDEGKAVYGINTGFGKLANTHIADDELELLQRNLVLSHSVGVGALLSDEVVRLTMLLKIASLARGYSGVRPEVVDALVALLNADVYPCIPSKGSVGASGDLAPLAHMSAVLLGLGEVRCGGKILPAADGLKRAALEPLRLGPKEGLALLNGTQVSTALALTGLFETQNVFAAAMVAGSMSVDAAMGSDTPFDDRIHQLRGHRGQIETACRLSGAAGGQQDPRVPPHRRRQGAGPLQPALPAAGDGCLPRRDAPLRGDPAHRGQRRHRQSAGLSRDR